MPTILSNCSRLKAVVFLILSAGSAPIFAADPGPGENTSQRAADTKTAPERRVVVTISKETTYINGPLRKDGYVDYVSALNLRYGKDVTPENNFAVPFWKVVGPSAISKSNREAYFKLLGIAAPPEPTDGFTEIEEYARKLWKKTHDAEPPERVLAAVRAQFDVATQRPWSRRECPVVAAWITVSGTYFAQVADASLRPRRFDPLVPNASGALFTAELPFGMQLNRVARGIWARARLRVGEGETAQAWQDALVLRRLARLAAQGPTALESLIGTAIEGMALEVDQDLFRKGQLSAAQAMRMRDELSKLAPAPALAEKFDNCERFMALDTICFVARAEKFSDEEIAHSPPVLKNIMGALNHASTPLTVAYRDPALRQANSWLDRMSKILHEPVSYERRNEVKRIVKAIHDEADDNSEWRKQAQAGQASRLPSLDRGASVIVMMLLPAIGPIAEAEDRTTMQAELTKLGFALAAYRADRGSYPAQLKELSPKYTAAVPKDLFNGEELHYRQDGDGYSLYSVGANGLDDGGKGYGDAKNGERWDDLSIRASGSKKK
jgi:hypothetical protein